MTHWNAYHFVGDRLRDGRPVPADGETLVREGEIRWCKTGLYASPKVWQALEYAPGPTLCRVRCDRIERREDDKFVCRERTIVARIDATDLLREYARSCALDVIHLWDAPDVVRRYLETGDESLMDAARAAAGAAAAASAATVGGAAAAAAAWAAAWGAARSAARGAAVAVQLAAARDAAWAAWGAAGAAWDAPSAAPHAAAAARDAAWAAARTKQRARLTRMVNAAFEAQA